MKKILSAVFAVMLSFMSLPATVFAYTTDGGNEVGVHDLANVLSESEESSLLELGITYADKHDLDIVFLTASDTNGKSSMVYSDDFYDGLEGDYKYAEDGILVFVDLDNGYDYVNTVGSAIENISDYEIEWILDEAFEVPEKDYYGRLETMIKESIEAYEYNSSSGYSVYNDYDDDYDEYKGPVISFRGIIFGVFVSAATICVLLMKHNSANKKTNATKYINDSQSSFKKIGEKFVDSYEKVSKDYYKPKSSSSGGSSRGGSSHRSSSGRSHGGGGRKR